MTAVRPADGPADPSTATAARDVVTVEGLGVTARATRSSPTSTSGSAPASGSA